MLDLNDLRIFARVATSGSFAAAAQALGLSKSTVSLAISRLEEELGVTVFRRTTRRVSLTPVGQRLLVPIQRGLVELDGVEVVRRSLRDEPSGLLRVAAPMTFTRDHLTPLLPEFLRRYPRIELEIEMTNRMFDVLSDDVDVVLTITPPMDKDVVVQRVTSSPVHLYASPAYVRGKRRPKTLDDVVGWDILHVGRGQAARVWDVLGPGGKHSVPVTPRLVVNDPFIQRALVIEGLGVAWLPARMCDQHVERGQLALLLPEWQMSTVNLYVVHAGRRSILPNIRAFVDFVVSEVPMV